MVDSSALVAIAFAEPQADDLLSVVLTNPCVIGAPTLLETAIVIDRAAMTNARAVLARVLASPSFHVVSFEAVHALLAP